MMLTVQHRHGLAGLLLYILLLQSCQAQLHMVSEEDAHVTQAKSPVLMQVSSDILSIASPSSQTTATTPYDAAIPPTQAIEIRSRQSAAEKHRLSAQMEEQEARELPEKRPKTEEGGILPLPNVSSLPRLPEHAYDVFISHAGEDKERIAVPLYKELKRLGLNIHPFVDREEIKPGTHGLKTIIKAMETAPIGVFILSPEFVARKWPMKELRCFLRRYKEAENQSSTPPLLVPVFHRLTWTECEMKPSLFFAKHQFCFASEKSDFMKLKDQKTKDAYLEEAMSTLKQLKPMGGIERDQYDYQLIHKTTERVQVMVSRVRSLHTAIDTIDQLHSNYRTEHFSLVKSLFPGEPPKYVDALTCTLQLIEVNDKQKTPEDAQDDVATRHDRIQQEKETIVPAELFKPRRKKPSEEPRSIQKVLIVGNPGMGKTTLSKQLAYRWAKGDLWDDEFKAVYVLPVRNLLKHSYDNGGYRKEATLATAIVNNCFTPPTEKIAYQALQKQIAEQLDNPTTLVVLDGLDERAGACEALIEQATTGKHKLLMLSRSYGIERESQIADTRVEHVGLSEAQMQDYVKTEALSGLSSAQSGELLSLLNQRYSIAEIAQVPVNLQILCFLWRDQVLRSRVREAVDHGSLPALYRVVTREIWKRYVARTRALQLPTEVREAMFDTLGKIALESLKEKKLLIRQELVDALVEESTLQYPDEMNMQDAGFLLLQWLKGSGLYQFPHLTFQEYFGGRWLAKQLFSSDKDDKEEAEDFIKDNKYVPRYGRLFSFMAGETANEPNKRKRQTNFGDIVTLADTGSQDMVGVQHLLLQMRLFNEYLCVNKEDIAQKKCPELEESLKKVGASLEQWLKKGIDKARGGRYGKYFLLQLFTSAMQDFRAVTKVVGPRCLDHLLEASKDTNSDVRRDAWVLSELVKAAPALAPECLASFLEACKDEDSSVRRNALQALSKVAEAAPALAPECLDPLLEASKDKNSYVRRDALQVLRELVKAAPSLAPRCLDHLLEASKDKDSYVRAALGALSKVAEAAPSLAPRCLDHLLEASKDSDVRRNALQVLREVAKAHPALAPRCLDTLLEASKDKDSYVRGNALQALREVVKIEPTLAQRCLDRLLEASKDKDSDVRRNALQALREVAKTEPTLAQRCLDRLLEASKDKDSYVRRDALQAFREVVKIEPTLAQHCLDTLSKASKDKDSYVRRDALQALREVAKTEPKLDPRCLDTLLEASKDKHSYVRRAALEALREVAKTEPTLAQHCLDALLEASKDKDSYVCGSALRILGTVSTKQLMEGYWATKNQNFLPIMLPQFYRTPLVVTDSYATMFWYDTAGNRVSWDKPQEEIKQFVSVVRNNLFQMIPHQ